MNPGTSRPARGTSRTGWPVLGAVLLLGAGQPPGDPAAPQKHVIEIRAMAFHPASLIVAPGDTVVWINRDLVPHTATTETSPGFDTGILSQAQSGSLVAGDPGEKSYRCVLHPPMRGTLIIRPRRPPTTGVPHHEP